ncbi:hypothetical protein AYL99_09910 [Fonsecaea erecta]|uniref:NACHT domain-containing protein n=1 Tax=Fonsecaea erecta TaxID=1367422 RepID=A0A178Z7J2_9EURO|nr:hypothetical protein AYL99_09910 [Fonsecaea erecta]OAP55758.1 hypothetical protein AYL99_09910 [Fonsecaea erecta]
MTLSKPGGKRYKLRQWLSSYGSTPASSQTLPPSAPVTPQSPTSTTLTTVVQDFHNRVFSFLSQQDRDTIRQHSVTNATNVDEIVQQILTAARQKQTICQSKRWTVAFRGHTVVLREKADNIVKWLDRFKQVGDIVSNVDPVHVGLPWAGIRLLLEAAISEQGQMEALVLGLEMTLYLSNRLEVYMNYITAIPPSQARANFESCLVEFHALVLRFLAQAIRIYQKGSVARGFDAFWRLEDVSTFEDECNKLASRAEIEASNCDRRILDTILKQLEQLKDLRLIHSRIQQLEAKVDLGKLPVAAGAAFDSYQDELDARCYPDTRVDVLRDIYAWANDINAETIFWINGMAGTGKSTISRTVAQTLADRGQLGASFFFKRGERDRENASLFYPTIAHELVRRIPALRPFVQKAVEDDPGIAGRALKEQFEKLVFQPLTSVSPIQAESFVLVIDALDECGREGDIGIIISQLVRTRELSTNRFRVFLTSRPELPIRLGFAKINTSTHRDIVLQDIPPATIEHDISVYLSKEFTDIREKHQCLLPPSQSFAPGWPDPQDLNTLTRLAVPLFIVAATICRFVGDVRGNPVKRLAQILNQPIGQKPQLELTYLPVLSQILVGVKDVEEQKELLHNFRRIVGSIVLLADPLSAASLARLLDVESTEVYLHLRFLHSVLWIRDDDTPIHLLHLSFREFLTQRVPSDASQPFQIVECKSHRYLADRCLVLLGSSTGLRKDICRLGDPGSLRTEIDAALIERCIPQHLQYACRYWVYHAERSGHKIYDEDDIDHFLRQHFFHWLECLSLLGRTSDSITLIGTLQSLVAEEDSEISTFLRDARRFVLTFHFIISHAPLQVYGSTWHFSPLQSRVRYFFQDQRLLNIDIRGGLPDQWSACLQTLEGHSASVSSVVFSPDGSRIASGSDDETVRVWDIQTGVCQYTLEGHSDWVWIVVFSPDGSRIASGSDDKTVRVWDVQTGVCQYTLEGHSDWVRSVVFSPDGSRIASGSGDETVRVWDVQTGVCQYTLEGHSDWVRSVVFSPDGSRIASGSGDKTVRVWDVQTGVCQYTLEGHSASVRSVVFSPDGSRIASGSGDKTVRVWDVQTGVCQYTLEGHSDWVRSVVFSPDGSRIASVSYDKTVRVWDVQTGVELLYCETDTYDNHVEFSDNDSNISINGQVVTIPGNSPRATVANLSSTSNSAPDGKLGIIGDWVMWASHRILWLPPEYRPGSWD